MFLVDFLSCRNGLRCVKNRKKESRFLTASAFLCVCRAPFLEFGALRALLCVQPAPSWLGSTCVLPLAAASQALGPGMSQAVRQPAVQKGVLGRGQLRASGGFTVGHSKGLSGSPVWQGSHCCAMCFLSMMIPSAFSLLPLPKTN